MGYSYYDSPEGEDCFKKLWYTGKIATGLGLTASTYDVLFYSHPQGYYQTLARFGHYTFPFIGMAAAFTSTVCIATSFRKKDDVYNYFMGGVAAGSIAGVWRKSIYTGFLCGVAFGIAAMVKKSCVEEGWEMFPRPARVQHGNIRSVRHDHTLYAERPRGWVTGEQ